MGKQNELTFEFALFAFKAWMGFWLPECCRIVSALMRIHGTLPGNCKRASP